MTPTIPLAHLLFIFVPAFMVIAILYKWSLNAPKAIYGMSRMLVQLSLIGYFLTYIFESDHAGIVLLVLLTMVLLSSWIALGNIKDKRRTLIGYALLSILVGGGIALTLVIFGVLTLDPWYAPRYVIPLAGMIFANSMNSISLAGERFYAEYNREDSYIKARNTAFQASLIPITNSLFAVGLVSIPGMMTGQILSGTDPLIAARYQVMVMCMVYASAGLSAAVFLTLIKKTLPAQSSRQP